MARLLIPGAAAATLLIWAEMPFLAAFFALCYVSLLYVLEKERKGM